MAPIEETQVRHGLVLALAGSPFTEKEGLFERLTGSWQKGGRWPPAPGALPRREGELLFGGRRWRVVELPGTFGLGRYTEDEVVARQFLLATRPAVVVNLLRATALPRELPLTMELLEMGLPVVLALEERHRWGTTGRQRAWLAKVLQVPVVVLRPGRGPALTDLLTRALELASAGRTASPPPAYQPAFAQALATLTAAIAAHPGLARAFPPRWLALKLLQDPTGFWPEISTHPGLEEVQDALLSARRALEGVPGQGCEAWLAAFS